MGIKFLGNCLGVEIQPRYAMTGDDHAEIKIVVADDGNWYDGMKFSSHWLPELIEQLQWASKYIEDNFEPDPSGYGYVYKNKPVKKG